jgi:hypothetical protein
MRSVVRRPRAYQRTKCRKARRDDRSGVLSASDQGVSAGSGAADIIVADLLREGDTSHRRAPRLSAAPFKRAAGGGSRLSS